MYQWYETEDPQNNMEAADHDSHRQPVIANSSKNVESVSILTNYKVHTTVLTKPHVSLRSQLFRVSF